MQRYDVAVIGLGGMGSAVLAQCARRGMRSIGFEQFERSHDRGASSGRSRMIRKAYYEHPCYVPLVVRAYEAWRELERSSDTKLLHITGLLMLGEVDSALLSGALRSAREHDISVEYLSPDRARERFPMFAIDDSERAVYEADAGFIAPEAAIDAHLRIADRYGAVMQFGQEVTPAQALTYAGRVAICAGPWLQALRPDVPLEIERNVQHWFAAGDDRFRLGYCPAFLIDRKTSAFPLYGFPDYGWGVKAAFHGSGQITHAGELDRVVHESDIAPVRLALDRALPGAAGAYLEGKACMYALTPDRHFMISMSTHDDRVVIAGGFSGHGFKFAPVIGEVVCAMLAGEPPGFDITPFQLQRFGATR
jgi:sarcosine oxidase